MIFLAYTSRYLRLALVKFERIFCRALLLCIFKVFYASALNSIKQSPQDNVSKNEHFSIFKTMTDHNSNYLFLMCSTTEDNFYLT